MVKIILELADNGIIKTIEDNNSNGADSKLILKSVYDLSNDENFKETGIFFNELSSDLGINLGNDYDKDNLYFMVDWGNKYNPTRSEVKNKIKELKNEINTLKLKITE